MTLQPIAMLRHALAAVLVLTMMLAWVGRGFAAASDGVIAYGVPGDAPHICHAGAGGGSAPADPGRHDCCEFCACQVPFALASPPSLPSLEIAARAPEPAGIAAWDSPVARLRTPRQAQGPPVV